MYLQLIFTLVMLFLTSHRGLENPESIPHGSQQVGCHCALSCVSVESVEKYEMEISIITSRFECLQAWKQCKISQEYVPNLWQKSSLKIAKISHEVQHFLGMFDFQIPHFFHAIIIQESLGNGIKLCCFLILYFTHVKSWAFWSMLVRQ